MAKCISSRKLTDTISLAEYNDGFYIYDKIAGYNIVMRAKTEENAFIMALEHYQKKHLLLKGEHSDLRSKVNAFILSTADSDVIFDLTETEEN